MTELEWRMRRRMPTVRAEVRSAAIQVRDYLVTVAALAAGIGAWTGIIVWLAGLFFADMWMMKGLGLVGAALLAGALFIVREVICGSFVKVTVRMLRLELQLMVAVIAIGLALHVGLNTTVHVVLMAHAS